MGFSPAGPHSSWGRVAAVGEHWPCSSLSGLQPLQRQVTSGQTRSGPACWNGIGVCWGPTPSHGSRAWSTWEVAHHSLGVTIHLVQVSLPCLESCVVRNLKLQSPFFSQNHQPCFSPGTEPCPAALAYHCSWPLDLGEWDWQERGSQGQGNI